MFSRNKVKKLKTVEDAYQAILEMGEELKKFIYNDSVPVLDRIEFIKIFYALKNIKFNSPDMELYKLYVEAYDEFEADRHLLKSLFILGEMEMDEYINAMTNNEFDKLLSELTSDKTNSHVTSDSIKYIKDDIDAKRKKASLENKFRLGSIEYQDYEIEKSNIEGRPYVMVSIAPSNPEIDSDEIEVDVRTNDNFIKALRNKGIYEERTKDNGEVDDDYIIEQWFHTTIIVLAANMLKESDLETFRSVASDSPASDIINTVEFDLENVPEEYREQLEEFQHNRRIYR